MPPLAVALRPETSRFEVVLTAVLWVLGWFPGVIYAIWLITADSREVRDASLVEPFPPGAGSGR